jgi:effector-binding domain-containing protein
VAYEIVTELVAARPMAAVRRQVRIGQVAGAWKPALDQVWAYLRRHDGLRTDGHNIFLYHHPPRRGEPMEVEFGVEVARTGTGEGEVVFTHTPAGLVASTRHVGPYDRLAAAHDAIHAWAAANARTIGSASWEIYGDWTDDPAELETQVVYLLA